MKLSVFLIFVGALELCAGSRILFLIPIPSKSHYILAERLMEELVENGHEITMISPFKKLKPMDKITEIVLPDFKETFLNQAMIGNSTEGKFSLRRSNTMSFLLFMDMPGFIIKEVMSHKAVTDLVKSDQKFDLVVGECFLMDALLAGFSKKFNAPLVGIATAMPNTWAFEMVGNPAPASYIPDPFLGYTEKMNFFERMVNFLYTTMYQIIHYNWYLPTQDKLMRQYFGDHLPPIKEIISNTSLVLVNHHYGLAFPRPLLPNMVEVGSFHVKPPKPLPQQLKKFMDEGKDGVIFFSMGSNLESKEFPKEKFDGILKAFSKLKQRVLWKFEAETSSEFPKNVKISKWLPQSDILAHPNVKLFITHGGLLSLTESVVSGVPIIGIPIFGDQPVNVKYAEKYELGVKLDYDDIDETSMFNAIQEVLNNPKYSNNMKFRSKLLNDLPMSTIDTAIYWLEYVIRHKGATHLRSAAQDLAWYQLYLLDVYAFLGVALFGFLFICRKIVCCVRRTLFGGKSKQVKSSKKEN